MISNSSGDTLIWNNPIPNAYYGVKIGVNASAIVGNLYSIQSIVYPLNDYYPTNNITIYNNCFGGNFKTTMSSNSSMNASANNVQSNGDIPSTTQHIDYTIQFQNNGGNIKNYVSIFDSIDSNLDLSSFEMLYSSHPVQTQINRSTRVVNFNMKNLALPTSSMDDLKSRGFVRFRLKLLAGLQAGTQIKNQAKVYLDYSNPDFTNQTINTLVVNAGLSLQELTKLVEIYPNPSKAFVSVKSTIFVSTVNILNALGEVVMTREVNANQADLDLTNFAKGVYIIRLNTKDGLLTKKIIKE